MKMNEFRDSCISGLSEKCLLKDQIHNNSVMISDEDFDPLALPLDSIDADKVAECVSLFNIKENCANCSSRCGEALRKGECINAMQSIFTHRDWTMFRRAVCQSRGEPGAGLPAAPRQLSGGDKVHMVTIISTVIYPGSLITSRHRR